MMQGTHKFIEKKCNKTPQILTGIRKTLRFWFSGNILIY